MALWEVSVPWFPALSAHTEENNLSLPCPSISPHPRKNEANRPEPARESSTEHVVSQAAFHCVEAEWFFIDVPRKGGGRGSAAAKRFGLNSQFNRFLWSLYVCL